MNGRISPRTGRFLRSLAAGALGALLVALTVWAHVQWINGVALTKGHDPSTPSIALTPVALFFDALGPSFALILPLGILAALSGPWPLRLLSVMLLLSGWYWVAEQVASRFAPHFGAAWLPGDAFAELFHVPWATPAMMALAALAYLIVLSRLNRAPRP